MTTAPPLAHDEYWDIYRKVPRLTVELVLRDRRGVLLTRRDSDPCKGIWHIPGGTVRFAEPLEEAVARIGRDKLGVDVASSAQCGVIEYPSHYLKGLDCPVGVAFDVRWEGEPRPVSGASECGWFVWPPAGMHDEQADFLDAMRGRWR
jgi:ADP-ribose pyrophosphatase YjhB (NUDIX family)